jgi:hypothetical protein
VQQVAATLDPGSGSIGKRQARFAKLRRQFQSNADDKVACHMGKVMASFEPGLFVGAGKTAWPQDNLDLERWFRKPKGHERRIHGRRHAGVRIVQEGPTLALALDAHLTHAGPFTVAELYPYRHAPIPRGQRDAIHRRGIMRKARSRKRRHVLLAELERRYLDGS